MADYLLKNPDGLSKLLANAGVDNIPELEKATNTQEFREKIKDSENTIERISKYLILKHIYDHAELEIGDYETSVNRDLTELLGSEPAHESVFVQRKSELKFPFRIWTKRTTVVQFSVIGLWLIFLIWLYLEYPEMWIFTFHLPISGMAMVFLPAVILTFLLPRLFGQEKFENINNTRELVNEVYALNQERIWQDNLSYFGEQLNKHLN